MKFYSQNYSDAIKELNTSEKGLSEKEAETRLAKNGKNKLKNKKGKPLIVRFIKQLIDPMILVLIGAAVVSGVLAYINGEGYADVIIIMAVVLLNAILGVYQESKAEKAIEALQKMSASNSKVLRDGIMKIVKSEDLVIGDIVLLEAGDAVPADGRLIESASLKIEESALTGESVPVDKTTDALSLNGVNDIPLGDRKNMVYMGSTVVYGRGVFVVTATAMKTEMGKIADALLVAEDNETPLQKKLKGLSKTLTYLVLIICVAVFVVQLFKAEGDFDFKFALDAFMIAVSLAVAAIPEGLAAVVTVVLSIGVTKMSKNNAIIRKLTAVETLGSTQIICSDKTGTLTQNKMTVVDYFGESEELIAMGMALCSDAETDDDGNVTGEPTEMALVAWTNKLGNNKNRLKEDYPRVGEAPFDSNRKMMTTIHKTDDGYVQFTKGAPDVVIDRCTHYIKNGQIVKMTAEYKGRIILENKKMANKALRVLALAERDFSVMPSADNPQVLENSLCFVGLCGMIDPIRPEVKDAIVKCREAGIRPIMITGDHIDTAVAIAEELGILEGDLKAVTGNQLSLITDEEFETEFKNISVYARVQPEHKTRIVNAWKKAGYITAMTGDGVNDAPSIKSADIGIGMGITGTDVTKNVADMVLADDNFATIVKAAEEGRRIYDNVRKAIQFLLGSNMSEVLAIFASTLFGFTILKPVHLLWINLVTDCFPALALGMEKAEPGIMKRKPRKAERGIFAGGMAFDIIYQGIIVTLLVFISYFIGVGSFDFVDSEKGITMAFLTMSFAEVFHSINLRSQRKSLFSLTAKNIAMIFSTLGAIALTTVVCEIPYLANLFGFASVGIKDYLIALGLGVVIIPLVEGVKFIQRLFTKKED